MHETNSNFEAQTKVAAEFRYQGQTCADMGSPLYAELCSRIASDVEAGGPCWTTIAPRADLRFGLALPLRFLGGVHRLGHLGRATELSGQYPSLGGRLAGDLWSAFLAVVERESIEITAALDRDVQTNEVGRSAALSEGLRAIQSTTGLPLSLLEIGASGGLNLRLDHFTYVDGDRSRGGDGGNLQIADRWRGLNRPQLGALNIVDRLGCDPNPIDPTTSEGRATLLGFLWPDQLERIARTDAAIAIAKRVPATVVKAHADTWIDEQLAQKRSTATVVYHSIVWQYIDRDERTRITERIESSGAATSASSPIAWLSFEPRQPDRKCAALTLRLWDGGDHNGEPQILAISGFHGEWVELGAS